jgi:hypothetical protein
VRAGLLERGIQVPSLLTVINIANALGIQPTLLVTMTVGRLRREAQQ